jgi:ADP-ribose pyrophosphatase YjhB (NUDIX family)
VDILQLLDEVRILASNGLEYADNEYDRDRYTRLMELVAEYYGHVLDLPPPEVRERFRSELGHITPKVGSDGAIFDDSGRILLMKRVDNGTWCLPCGWIEPDEAPSEAVSREVREETGLKVRPTKLVGLFPRQAGGTAGPHIVISVLYLCEVLGGTLACSSEGSELRYWEIDDVPEWHAHHERLARAAREAIGDRWRG